MSQEADRPQQGEVQIRATVIDDDDQEFVCESSYLMLG
jgi:hypothetical protein